MTIQDAFARLVEIEGVAEVAFQTFCRLLHTQKVHALRKNQDDGFYFQDDLNDERPLSFIVTYHVWNILDVELRNGLLKIGYEMFYNHDKQQVFINGKDYDPFVFEEWTFAIKTADIERFMDGCTDVAPVASNKGGAPTKYDWAAAGAVAASLIVEKDYPEDPAELERLIREWFREVGGEPDKRDTRQFIKTLYVQKQRLEALRKTRFPEFSASQR